MKQDAVEVWAPQAEGAGDVAVRIVRAATGVVPLVGSALSELVDYSWKRWQQPRVAAFIEEVTRQAALRAWSEDVVEDPANAELLVRALHASMEADTEVKARALGRIAASAVGGDSPIDEARLVIASLARIEAPHVRVLAALAEPRPGGMGYPDGEQIYGQVSEDLLRQRVPGAGRALGAVMSVLEAEGLVVEHVSHPYANLAGPEWSVTQHGQLLLEHIQARAGSPPEENEQA